jgi:hypothetical protein
MAIMDNGKAMSSKVIVAGWDDDNKHRRVNRNRCLPSLQELYSEEPSDFDEFFLQRDVHRFFELSPKTDRRGLVSIYEKWSSYVGETIFFVELRSDGRADSILEGPQWESESPARKILAPRHGDRAKFLNPGIVRRYALETIYGTYSDGSVYVERNGDVAAVQFKKNSPNERRTNVSVRKDILLDYANHAKALLVAHYRADRFSPNALCDYGLTNRQRARFAGQYFNFETEFIDDTRFSRCPMMKSWGFTIGKKIMFMMPAGASARPSVTSL